MFMEFQGVENARQLGGLVRKDGRRIKKDLLFRTGHLAKATEEDIRRLEELGISHVIDFRDGAEVKKSPDRIPAGAEHHHIPALGDLRDLFKKKPDDPTMTPEEIHRDFTNLYGVLARGAESQAAYEEFFRILLASEGKPVLWHCTQGKDRTGIAAILLLGALGFDEGFAIEEYLLTNRFAQKQLAAMEQNGATERQLALLGELLPVFRENAEFYLHCIQLEHFSLRHYLELVLGVGPGEIEKLETYYLE